MTRRGAIDPLSTIAGGVALVSWCVIAAGGTGAAPSFCGGGLRPETVPASIALVWGLSKHGLLAMEWLAMATVMAPMIVEPLRHIRARSFSSSWPLLGCAYAAGYFAVWLAAIAAIQSTGLALRTAIPGRAINVLLTATIVLVWQICPVRQRHLNRCHHRPPLPAFGFRSVSTSGAYGLKSGLWCVSTCGPLMLLAYAAGPAHAVAMAGVALIAMRERALAPRRPTWRLAAIVVRPIVG